MRNAPPPLLAILRSDLQGRLLAAVYLRTWDAGVTISDLARFLGAPVATVQREVRRLVSAGLLAESVSGRNKYVLKPHDQDALMRPLTELLAVTYGPLPVLEELMAGVAGVEEAYIFGSWAARYRGEAGPVPNDVDVLVVGDAPNTVLDALADRAQRRLHREVNISRVRPRRWRDPGEDVFIRTVRSRPLIGLTTASQAGEVVDGALAEG